MDGAYSWATVQATDAQSATRLRKGHVLIVIMACGSSGQGILYAMTKMIRFVKSYKDTSGSHLVEELHDDEGVEHNGVARLSIHAQNLLPMEHQHVQGRQLERSLPQDVLCHFGTN